MRVERWRRVEVDGSLVKQFELWADVLIWMITHRSTLGRIEAWS